MTLRLSPISALAVLATLLASAATAQNSAQPQVEIVEVPTKADDATPATATPRLLVPETSTPDASGVVIETVTPNQKPATVDEAALRYYARQGDMRRLQAEIERLRAQHPGWQPPDTLFDTPAPAGPDESPVWALLQNQDFAAARAMLAELRRGLPSWKPSAALENALQVGETRDRMNGAASVGDWPGVMTMASGSPSIMSCANIDLRWLQAEAMARTGDKAGAQGAYSRIIADCADASQRLSTIQKASALLDRAAAQTLFNQEKARPRTAVQETALADWWKQYERGSVAANLGRAGAEIDPQSLEVFSKSVSDSRDADGARTLGWYYYNRKNYSEALPWFERSMGWAESGETAEGLVLTYRALRRTADMNRTIAAWKGRSSNVAKLARDFAPKPAAPQAQADPRGAIIGQAGQALSDKNYAACLRLLQPLSAKAPLPPDGRLIQGYCLHALNRGVEAKAAFTAVLASSGITAKLREDAIFGLALSTSLSGSYSEIAALLDTYGISAQRRTEVLKTALASLANAAFDLQDYHETLRALDMRATLAPEPRDLMVARAWSLYHLRKYKDAVALFKTLDQTFSTADSREGLKVAQAAAYNDTMGE